MFGCSFINMKYISESRKGYTSQFLFKCKMCNIEKKINTFKETPQNSWSTNKSIVNSTISIGV